MTCKRAEIKKAILSKNGKMKHKALKISWYEKNNLLYILKEIYFETAFLNQKSTIRERIFYIEKDLYKQETCTYCSNPVNLSPKLKFLLTCGENSCKKKRNTNVMNAIWENRTMERRKEISDKISKKLSGRVQTDKEKSDKSLRMIGRKQTAEHIKNRTKVENKMENLGLLKLLRGN